MRMKFFHYAVQFFLFLENHIFDNKYFDHIKWTIVLLKLLIYYLDLQL